MTSCPLCGAKVLYEGLTSIECAGAGCANGSVPKTPPSQFPVGGWIKYPTMDTLWYVHTQLPDGRLKLLCEGDAGWPLLAFPRELEGWVSCHGPSSPRPSGPAPAAVHLCP